MTASPGPTASTESVERGLPARVFSLLLTNGFLMMSFGAVALLMPVVREQLDISFSQAGALASISVLLYASMQIPAGYFADRFGSKRVLIVGFGLTGCMTLAFGLVQNFPQALIVQAVFGFSRALAFAPALLLISRWFGPERRSTAFSLLIAGGFGFQVTLNLIGPTLEELIGWRAVFVGMGVLGVASVLVFIRVASDPRPAAASTHSFLDGFGLLVKSPAMWIIGAIQFIRLAVANSYIFWMPTFLVEDHGLSLSTAGFVVALGAAVTALANFGGGYVADRLNRPLHYIAGAMSLIGTTTLLISAIDNTVIVIALYAVNAMFVQVYFGPLFALPMAFLRVRNEGTATGFSNLFANLGAVTFAYTLGAIKDRTDSFSTGFLALAVMTFIGVGLVALLSRMPGREEPTVAPPTPALEPSGKRVG
ncbi:MAG: MFS transporter [Dehalococcoidia bacterium]|nr:MFS transporter [Dehalococcoidia bacterium]